MQRSSAVTVTSVKKCPSNSHHHDRHGVTVTNITRLVPNTSILSTHKTATKETESIVENVDLALVVCNDIVPSSAPLHSKSAKKLPPTVSVVRKSRSQSKSIAVNMDQQPHDDDFSQHPAVTPICHNIETAMPSVAEPAEIIKNTAPLSLNVRQSKDSIMSQCQIGFTRLSVLSSGMSSPNFAKSRKTMKRATTTSSVSLFVREDPPQSSTTEENKKRIKEQERYQRYRRRGACCSPCCCWCVGLVLALLLAGLATLLVLLLSKKTIITTKTINIAPITTVSTANTTDTNTTSITTSTAATTFTTITSSLTTSTVTSSTSTTIMTNTDTTSMSSSSTTIITDIVTASSTSGSTTMVTTTKAATTVTITSNTCTSGWHGVTIFYHCYNTCPALTSYIQYTYTYVAIANKTRITFAFRQDNYFFALDDVTVWDNAAPGVQLLLNNGFETGSLSSWVYCNPSGASYAGKAQATSAHYSYSGHVYASNSGAYFYLDGSVGAADYLSQLFTTIIGDTYTISYWLSNPSGGTGVSVDVMVST